MQQCKRLVNGYGDPWRRTGKRKYLSYVQTKQIRHASGNLKTTATATLTWEFPATTYSGNCANTTVQERKRWVDTVKATPVQNNPMQQLCNTMSLWRLEYASYTFPTWRSKPLQEITRYRREVMNMIGEKRNYNLCIIKWGKNLFFPYINYIRYIN